jgi:hypothetical protein
MESLPCVRGDRRAAFDEWLAGIVVAALHARQCVHPGRLHRQATAYWISRDVAENGCPKGNVLIVSNIYDDASGHLACHHRSSQA